jgi:hypothetical protein
VNRAQNQRATRWARRVVVDGRLVAAHLPNERHGLPSTYTNHGCQCGPCTQANTDHWRNWYQAKRQDGMAA